MNFNKRVPKEYYEECANKGTIEEITYKSKMYVSDLKEVEKKALVYLPFGYDANKEAYKTIYLMHGGGGDYTEFLYGQDKSHALVHILDRLMESGELEKCVVVTPSFYYSDSQSALHDIGEAGQLTAVYHNEFRNELVPYIDSHYNVVKNREGRAFGGFSMGGETTWEILLNCADLVKHFIPLSGDCWIIEPKASIEKPAETVEAMKQKLISKGFDKLPLNIFAFTGDLDIAYPALNAQIAEMKKTGLCCTNESSLRYVSWAEGTHCYQYIYEYLYNLLPELF